MKKLLTLIAILFIWFMFSSCWEIKQDVNNWSEVDNMSKKISKQENNKNNMENVKKFDQLAKPIAWDTIAIFETSMGDIKVKLFPNKTPKTVENFTKLAKKWYHNWVIFHRVIKDFMIQWWDPTWTWMWWESIWWHDFEDEFNSDLKNIKWALSMANRWPNTNWSQFFIVQAEETPWLNWKHTVFWQVFEWIDIVDKIANVKTWPMDKPLKDIVIKDILIKKM